MRCSATRCFTLSALVFAGLSVFSGRVAQAEPEHEGLPMSVVDRPLTLPAMTLAPTFQFDVTHLEIDIISSNAVGMSLGASFGVLDDLEVYLMPFTLLIVDVDAGVFGSDTKTYYGTFRLGGTYRFFHEDVAELGARVEFGATGFNDDIHLTWGMPVLLRAPNILRLSTGLFFTAFLPTDGGRADIGIAAVSESAPVLLAAVGPGIPATLDFRVLDEFFLGLDTGFGVASFRGNVDQNCFMPLGFHAGGTIPIDNKPTVDLLGAFSFPYFLVGADNEPPLTNIWTVGLTARAYIPL
ncbi:MAG: hypothetical protein U0271_37585 [Polyangiaceae bacterium]